MDIATEVKCYSCNQVFPISQLGVIVVEKSNVSQEEKKFAYYYKPITQTTLDKLPKGKKYYHCKSCCQ